MKLASVTHIENDWLEVVGRPDAVQFQLDAIQEQFAALQASILQLRKSLMPQPMKRFRYVILFPSGERMNCVSDCRSIEEASAEAEHTAIEFDEFAIVEDLREDQ